MIHYDDQPAQLDRIALSNALYDLADRYQLEAAHWSRLTDCRAECTETSGILRLVARASLSADYDLHRGEAYYAAGGTLLDRVQAQRRFLTTLNTPPQEAEEV